MSFLARLRVCGADIELNFVSLEISQDTDVKGRPNSIARGGTIAVEFDAVYGNDSISDWMADPVQKESGKVVFMQSSQAAVLKVYSFTDALCVSFHERFDGTHTAGKMTTSLTFTAPKVDVGGVEIDNKWDEL